MSTRWWTFVTWALVAASAVFWGLKLFVKPAPLASSTTVAVNGPPARGDLTRLLGVDAPPPVAATAAEPPPDARFQLVGVLAAQPRAAAREGVALIAVDGKPAKAYRVGAAVEGQMVLKSVAARGASLGPRDGAAQVNLSLAPLPPPATGMLPGLTEGGAMPAQQPMPGQPALAPRFAPGNEAMQQTQRRILPPPQPGQMNPGEGPGQPNGQGLQQNMQPGMQQGMQQGMQTR
jgi:general secretion pathway protein C